MNDAATRRTIAQLTAALRAARRRVHAQRFIAALSLGLRRGIVVLLICAIVLVGFGAIKLPARLDRLSWWLTAVAVAALGAVIASLLVSLFRRPTLVEAAERVDLAAANHNRIATAIDLLRRGVATGMEEAAVADAVATLTQIERRPLVDPVAWLRRKDVTRLLVALTCVAMAWALPWLAGMWRRDVVVSTPADVAPQIATKASPVAVLPEAKKIVAATLPSEASSTGANAVAIAALTSTPDAQAAAVTGGASGGAGIGNAGATEKLAKSDRPQSSGPATPTPQPKSQPAKQSRGSGMGGAVRGSSSGSVGAGGKGSGGFSLASEKDVRAQDAADLDADPDTAGDNAEADENNENRHRGGAQPLLQDRLAAPTRELGIGGLKGSPGTGRGGPTPTKKARGAGALFLGVPMPDFVPGKLLAGTGKISRENIKPRRSDDPLPAPADVVPRAADESVLERFDVPLSDARSVSAYFNELHRDDAQPAPATTMPAPDAKPGVTNP